MSIIGPTVIALEQLGVMKQYPATEVNYRSLAMIVIEVDANYQYSLELLSNVDVFYRNQLKWSSDVKTLDNLRDAIMQEEYFVDMIGDPYINFIDALNEFTEIVDEPKVSWASHNILEVFHDRLSRCGEIASSLRATCFTASRELKVLNTITNLLENNVPRRLFINILKCQGVLFPDEFE